MTITEARAHYRTILNTLKAERAYRQKFLPEPRRTIALAEIDEAIKSLEHLGQIVQIASEANLLEAVFEQAPLLDLPDPRHYP